MLVSPDIQTQRGLYLILRRMKNHTLSQCHLCQNRGNQTPAWAHFSLGFNTQQEKSGSKLTGRSPSCMDFCHTAVERLLWSPLAILTVHHSNSQGTVQGTELPSRTLLLLICLHFP